MDALTKFLVLFIWLGFIFIWILPDDIFRAIVIVVGVGLAIFVLAKNKNMIR